MVSLILATSYLTSLLAGLGLIHPEELDQNKLLANAGRLTSPDSLVTNSLYCSHAAFEVLYQTYPKLRSSRVYCFLTTLFLA